MTKYLIASHGGLAKAAHEALQMIAGQRPDVRAVGLTPDQGPEQLQANLRAALTDLEPEELLVAFTDLRGGSPHNTVVAEFGTRPNTTVISGFNLPMMLDAVLSSQEVPAKIAKAGQGAIAIAGTVDSGEEAPAAGAAPAAAAPAAPASASSGAPKEIAHVRLDARGIHGQVATAWLPHLKVNRVMVIDEKAVHSDMQKMALRTALPETFKLSVLSPQRAAQRLADPSAYGGERILVLLLDTVTLDALADEGRVFEHVNLGNLPARPGAQQLRNTVYLTDEDRASLQRAIGGGTRLTAQMVPSDAEVNVGDQI